MTEAELRAKIREMIASGALPAEPPLAERASAEPVNRRTRTIVESPLHEPCTICSESGPQVQYFYTAGQVVRLHAACDAMWKLERTAV